MQLVQGIMSGATSLARTHLPPSAPPSLGQGGRRWEECRQGGERMLRLAHALCALAWVRTPITCQPRSVAAALATQKEQAVCDVIAYQGSQALIQHQAGLVLLGGWERHKSLCLASLHRFWP